MKCRIRKRRIREVAILANLLVASVPSSLLASYGYDALGRRVAATIGGISTRYYYEGRNVIEERDGTDARVRYHVNGGQFIDERVATFEDATTAFTYYLLKENFSVAGTGSADGSVIERRHVGLAGHLGMVEQTDGSALRTHPHERLQGLVLVRTEFEVGCQLQNVAVLPGQEVVERYDWPG